MKICVGLSGGVDSSVAALLLKQQGHEVFGLFMQNWHDASTTLHGDCEWEEDKFVAEMVARRLEIPFYFIDLSKEYHSRVVDYMFKEYAAGRTPNPDVLCNREIKFDAFLAAAEKLGAEMVATGHYCKKDSFTDPATGKEIYRLYAGDDPGKDQSYFLCQLSQEQLSKALFPIGHLMKKEVRALASEAMLQSADKKDSQGLCFVGKVDLPTFLAQALEPAPGDIVEVYDEYYDSCEHYKKVCGILSGLCREGMQPQLVTDYISDDKAVTSGTPSVCPYDEAKISALSDEDLMTISRPLDYSDIVFQKEVYRSGHKHIKKTRYKAHPWGKIIGTHDGAQFYTIGQRKGLNVGGHADSIFVISLDCSSRRIYVGEGHTHKGLSRNALRIAPEEIHWIRTDIAMRFGEIRRYKVRIRYRQPLQDATLLFRENGIFILFDKAQRGITAGQFAAWYNPETAELVGSGVIDR
ncbi:MAG: tRNA 2-thiouridine(34) synthase MnmA [Bacteroidales bacterium]|nr:tRNA 2-thiouridine(34) synthase MnmA [Bacteroidales bacterium]